MTEAGATHPSSGVHPPTSPSMPHLAARVSFRFAAMTLLMLAALFLPAGTLRWWQGWAFLAAMIALGLSMFLFLLKTDPEAVVRRLRAQEKEPEQKRIMRFGMLLFAGLFTLPGFDHRLGWSQRWPGAEPAWLEAFSLAMVALAMLAVGWVIWTNRYAARTIRVFEGQTVITGGPYRLVRHPMYAFSLVLWMFAPLALGSCVTLPVFALTLLFYVPRLLNEEKVLRAELPGYTEYCQKTRWRIVPGVW